MQDEFLTVPFSTLKSMRSLLFILAIFNVALALGNEPGPGYKLVERVEPDNHFESFGAPHIDTVLEVYSKGDTFMSPSKIVLSSLADPAKKELLFEFDRMASAILSPNGKWIIINDRPIRGHCEPRLFKQIKGLKFSEENSAGIREKAIKLFVKHNKLSKEIFDTMIGEGGCLVEMLDWSDDSSAIMVRVSMCRTGEPIWVQSWRCVYDLTNQNATTSLNVFNRGSIQSGRFLGK